MPEHTAMTATLTSDWDLSLDVSGNVALSKRSHAVAQNVANECRLFWGDAYFRNEDGIEWFPGQLGKPVNQAIVSGLLRKAAESVDGVERVTSIELRDLNSDSRTLRGVITFQTKWGTNEQVDF